MSTNSSNREKKIGPTARRQLNDDTSGVVDHYVIENERSSVNENESCSEKRNENDVTENEIHPRPANSHDAASPLNEPPNLAKRNDVTNESNDAENDSKGGADITVPGISENKKS